MNWNNLSLFWKIIILIIGGYILLTWYHQRPLTEQECYRLGSNERMRACLDSLSTPAPESTELSTEYLSQLTLTHVSIDRVDNNQVVMGRITNNVALAVEDVILRVRLYPYVKDGSKCDNSQLDTQYVKLERVFIPEDSYMFQETFTTIVPEFNYCVDVASATITE